MPAGGAPVVLTEGEPPAQGDLKPRLEAEAPTQSAEEEVRPAPAKETPGLRGPVAVTVRELTSREAQYAGREVTLSGRILTLCVRGCQLTLDDGTGVMGVELVGDALTNTLPLRSMGRQIEVTGVFRLAPRPHISVERPDGWRFR